MTQRLQAIIEQKKFNSVEWYTNCFEWLGWMKEENDFRKFQSMLESLSNNKFLNPREKSKMITFFYPVFEQRVKVISDDCKARHKKFNFVCKPVMGIIWGY